MLVRKLALHTLVVFSIFSIAMFVLFSNPLTYAFLYKYKTVANLLDIVFAAAVFFSFCIYIKNYFSIPVTSERLVFAAILCMVARISMMAVSYLARVIDSYSSLLNYFMIVVLYLLSMVFVFLIARLMLPALSVRIPFNNIVRLQLAILIVLLVAVHLLSNYIIVNGRYYAILCSLTLVSSMIVLPPALTTYWICRYGQINIE